jgi:hypothetical protein
LAAASLKKDRDVVLAALQQSGSAVRYVDESLKKDKEVVLVAVRGGGFHCVDDSLKNDKEVVIAAVTRDGRGARARQQELAV